MYTCTYTTLPPPNRCWILEPGSVNLNTAYHILAMYIWEVTSLLCSLGFSSEKWDNTLFFMRLV